MFRAKVIAAVAATALAGGLTLAAGTASAGNVAWNVSVGGPGFAVSAGGPAYRGYPAYWGGRAYVRPYYRPYYAAPVIYPAPVVYPAPFYPAPVVYAPYAPRVVVAAPVWRGGYRLY